MFNRTKFNKFQFNRLYDFVVLTPAPVHTPVINYRLILASPEIIPFFLVQSSDHKTPAPGLVPQVLFSSAGQPFRFTKGVVSEIGSGWYGVMPSSQDILGIAPLLLFVPPPAAGVDPCTIRIEVIPISGVVPLRVNMTRYPLTFYMTSDLDHIAPATGLTPTVLVRKSGGDFQSPAGSIAEIGHGWYMCAPDKADVDTVGPLVLEATGPGADPTFEIYDVMGSVLDTEIDRYTLTLLMIRTTLINSGLFTEATCVISLDRQPFPTPSIPSLWITPGGTSFDQELEAGGTRYTILASPIFTLNVIVRRMQDIEVHDQHWITNANRGAYPLIWKIINLLAGRFVYSVAGDQLTTRNLRPVNIGNPYRYNQDSMMSVVPIAFTTDVQIDLDLEYPYIPPR
jgi:hypothetical protein